MAASGRGTAWKAAESMLRPGIGAVGAGSTVICPWRGMCLLEGVGRRRRLSVSRHRLAFRREPAAAPGARVSKVGSSRVRPMRTFEKPLSLIVLLNIGHTLDHLFMLIYPTVVLVLAPAFGLPYSKMLPLSLGGFIAFGAGSLPAGGLRHRS